MDYVTNYLSSMTSAFIRAYARHPLRTLATGLSLIAAAGCSGESRYAWREQVRLDDGQIVLVERTARFRENWVAGGGGGSVNEGMTLHIVQAAASAPATAWDARLVPVVLERDSVSNEWVLIATFFHCDSWYELGRPALPYAEYRYRADRWTRQALSAKWIGHPSNVLPADPSKKAVLNAGNVLTVDRKTAIFEASTMAPEYRSVVAHWRTGC